MPEKKEKLKVLFLCTGNSCRSQMAEGWARHLRGDLIDAYSAGIFPAGVSSRAKKVMAEAGVDISGQASKHVSDLVGIDFDYIITLCDNARDVCPIFPGSGIVIHRPFQDPTFCIGSEQDVLDEFRKARDRIRDFIETLPQCLPPK